MQSLHPTAANTAPRVPTSLDGTPPPAPYTSSNIASFQSYYVQNYATVRNSLLDATMMQLPRIIQNVDRFIQSTTNGQRRFEPDQALVDQLVAFFQNDDTYYQRLPNTFINSQIMADRFSEDISEQFQERMLMEYRYDHFVVNARDRQVVSLFPMSQRGWKDEWAGANYTFAVPDVEKKRRAYQIKAIGAAGLPFPVTTFE